MNRWTKAAALLLAGAALVSASPAPAQDLRPGTFPSPWINGADCAQEQQVQVHWYNADTAILRQSLCTHPEGPFLYLLFGTRDALLLDTGAGRIDLASEVDAVVRAWEARSGRRLGRLDVAHSHAHPDHVQGDEQLRRLPYAKVVDAVPGRDKPNVDEVVRFFGVTNWPDGMATRDLGDRILDIIPIPGHEPSHIAVYDRVTGLLLTGDTLYPGRLYIPIPHFASYRRSIDRLVEFARSRPVTWVLGGHIEMTTRPKVDFEFGTKKDEPEHELQLPVSLLSELKEALDAMGNSPVRKARDHFIIFPRMF